MTETELLEHIERGARRALHDCAADALEGNASAVTLGRAARLVMQLAEFLRPLSVRTPGCLRILRLKLGALLELLARDEDLRAELRALHTELGERVDAEKVELARVAEAFERKAG